MRLEDLKGRRLGRYEILEVLGRGGMAAVYRARDSVLRRDVALKILYPQYAGDAALVERFQREAVLAAGLDHPNILPIYDVGDADGLVYIAMRLLSGTSFADVLRLRGSLPLHELLPIVDQVAAALDYAHARRIVHRDIKPANILIEGMDGDGSRQADTSAYSPAATPHAVLTDFGIAKSLDPAASGLTVTGVLIGTPEYMAPEQIRGGHTVDGRADVYALGVLVYRALTGRRPFEGSTEEVLLGHLGGTLVPPSSINPTLPPALNAVLLRALARDPEQRYRSAGEFTRALRSTASLELPTSPPALRRTADGHAIVPGLAGDVPIDAQPTRRGNAAPPATARNSALTSAELTRGEAALPYAPPTRRSAYDAPARRTSNVAWAIVGLILALLLGAGMFYGARLFASGGGTPAIVATSQPSARPAPTATSQPSAIATATAQPTSPPTETSAPTAPPATATSRPTSAPTHTPAPTARPRATPVPPAPTARPTEPATAVPSATATSVPPTATPTQAPTPTPCAVQPAAELDPFLAGQASVAAKLGCATQEGQSRPIAEQSFEHGAMIWVAGTTGRNGTIYVIYDDEPRGRITWLVFEDTWQEGDPADSGDQTPPNGRFEPQRGFGKLWYANQDIATAIGWATEEKETGGTGVVQRFANGRLLYSSLGFGVGPSVYELDQDGTFTSFKAPS